MELKERVHFLKDALREILPANPKKSFKIIDKMLAPLSDRSGLGNSAADTFALNPRGLEGFLLWPFAEYVAEVGIEHIDLSLNILKEITQRFTAEFAIRPFIHRYPKIVYPELLKWTNSESEHVRRLCSEGSRPRLPWGMKLDNAVTDPTQGIELLDKLKYDDSMYVRKSVANHLNDVSKDHPDVAINIFKRWIKQVPKMEQAKIVEVEINDTRNLYKTIAVRGSILYFTIADLGRIDPMYQNSLAYVKSLFNKAIAESPQSDTIEGRLSILIDNITRLIYTNISRGLFEKDKLIYSFLITTGILRNAELIDEAVWNILLRGPTVFTAEETA